MNEKEKMEEKKTIKISLLAFILIIAIIVMVYCIYKSYNEKTTEEETSTLKIGTYSINEMNVSPDEGNYGIDSIILKENNQFSVDMPLGTSYIGTYGIDGSNLICKATQQIESEGGGVSSSNINIIFTFQIVNNSKIQFLSVTNDELELTIGMTYSLK